MEKALNLTATSDTVAPSIAEKQIDMGFDHLPTTADVTFNHRYVRVKVPPSDRLAGIEFILDPRTSTFKVYQGDTKVEVCSMEGLKALVNINK